MRLPPLNALRAFEAAARHGGYIAAADELHVTRGAVSRHIKTLEDHLGIALFHRRSRGVELTEAGRQLLPTLTDAFQRMSEGVDRVSTARADLRIICPPATSIRWLMPKIGAFRAEHPEWGLQITTDYYPRSGFDTTAFNLGISVEHWNERTVDVEIEPIFPLVITPACAPQIAERLFAPDDLVGVPLLHERHERSDWHYWLDAFPVPGLDISKGDVFHNLDMAVKAAEMGAGVVMADLMLCREELARGSLVAPFPDLICDTPLGRFALIGDPDSWHSPPVAAFRDWIVERAAADAREVFAGTPYA